MDSPPEESKMLSTTPAKSSLRFAGEKDNPLEKNKILIRTPAENSLQFAARHVSSSEKSKMLTTPDESSPGFVGGKDSPLEKSKILISLPVEYPFKKGNPDENPFKTGTPVENSPNLQLNVTAHLRIGNPASAVPFRASRLFNTQSKSELQLNPSIFRNMSRRYREAEGTVKEAILLLVTRVSFPSYTRSAEDPEQCTVSSISCP